MTFEVFSSCSSDLKPALERFIKMVFDKEVNKVLYVVDETSGEKDIRKFWNKVIKDVETPPVLFITFSGAKPQSALEFVKQRIERWEEWKPTGKSLLRPVLKYLLGIEENG